MLKKKHVKEMHFMDGSTYLVSTSACRWCLIPNLTWELMNYLEPIYQDEDISIRQDAEWPLPWFFVVSVNQHIWSIKDIHDLLLCKIWLAIKYTRVGLFEKLNIEKTQIYQEERLTNSHYHVWILPIYKDYIILNKKTPKIYDRDVIDYIKSYSFDENKDNILKYNYIMRNYLNKEILLYEKLNSCNI